MAALRERGSSILVVAEKATEVLDLADFVVLMSLGRVVWSGARADLDGDRLAEVYLGGPSLLAHEP